MLEMNVNYSSNVISRSRRSGAPGASRSYFGSKRGSMSGGTGDDGSVGSPLDDDSPANDDSPA